MSDRWDEAAAELARVTAETPVRRRLLCERIVDELLAVGIEPPWPLTEPDDTITFCADCYWRRRFLDTPLLVTAVACARWLHHHATAAVFPVVGQRWALGYGFITRSTVDSATEVAETEARLLAAPGADMAETAPIAWLATTYHAAKLRANFHGELLRAFLDQSPLVLLAGQWSAQAPLPALRAFAALRAGDPDGHHRARSCAEHLAELGSAGAEILLHGMSMAPRPEEHGADMVELAEQALTLWPGNALLHYRHAEALRTVLRLDDAFTEADRALVALPANGNSDSHTDFQERIVQLRESIRSLMLHRAELDRRSARTQPGRRG